MLRHLDLFAGIAGFSLGLERTGGFKTVRFIEINEFCQKVIRKHYPDIPIDGDIRKAKFERGEADIVTAGFPCQDISYAGHGAGLAGERSGLYREALRAICLVRPDYALLENVAALLNRGMGTILADLAEIGYDAEWHCIPASHVGAPHNRDRAWVIANPQRRKRRQESYMWALGRMGRQQQSFPWDRNWESALREFRRMDDGLSYGVDRVDSIRNAVVPQIPEILGHAILEAERMRAA